MSRFLSQRLSAGAMATGLLLLPSLPVFAAGMEGTIPMMSALNPLVRAHRLKPVGDAPANQVLHLIIGLPSAHPGALSAFLANPHHAILSPSLFTERFGPQTSALSAVEAFLLGGGLSLTSSPSAQWVEASGTVAQVESLLHTSIRTYLYQGRTVYAAASAPLVPTSLAADVTGIVGLNDVTRPAPASGSGAPGTLPPILPTQMQAAYNLIPAYANGLQGQGVRIAIATFAPFSTQDVAHFLSRMGDASPGASNLKVVSVDNASTVAPQAPTLGSTESTLDAELSLVTAPAAAETVFVGPDTNTGWLNTYAAMASAGNNQVMSTSWGQPEWLLSPSFIALANGNFARMAAEGITAVAASGDSGPGPLPLSFPASDPYVLAVGGTQVTLNANNTLHSESAWVGTGPFQGFGTTGGYSGIFSMPPWQQGFLPHGETQRGVPDVALNAVGYTPYVGGQWTTPGSGTSAAAPQWAGILALADQYRTQKGLSPIGLAAPLLYPLAGDHSTLPDPFHAITQGSMNGFHAGAPWNPLTGLGSVNGWTLIQDLAQEPGYRMGSRPHVTGLYGSFPDLIPLSGQVLDNQAQAVAPGGQGFPVTVTGVNLGSSQGTVTVDGLPASVVSWSDIAISFQVPPSGPSGNWQAGSVPVSVYTSNNTLAGALTLQLVNSLSLSVQDSPTTVTVAGQNSNNQQVTVSLQGPSGQTIQQGNDTYGLLVAPASGNIPVTVYGSSSAQPLSPNLDGFYPLTAVNGTATYSVSSPIAGQVAYVAFDLSHPASVWPSIPSPVLGTSSPPPTGTFVPGSPVRVTLISPPVAWGANQPALITVGTIDANGNTVPVSAYGSGTFDVSFGQATGIIVHAGGSQVTPTAGGAYPIPSQPDGTATFTVEPGTGPLSMTVTDSTYSSLAPLHNGPVLFSPDTSLAISAPSTPVTQAMPVTVTMQAGNHPDTSATGSVLVQITAVGPLQAMGANSAPLTLTPIGQGDSSGGPVTYQTVVPLAKGEATFSLRTPVASTVDALTVIDPGITVSSPGGYAPLSATQQLTFLPGTAFRVAAAEPFPSVPVKPMDAAAPSLWQEIQATTVDSLGNLVPQQGTVFDLLIGGATGSLTVERRSSSGTDTVLMPGANGTYSATAGPSGFVTFLVADTAPNALTYTASVENSSLPAATVSGQFTTAMPAVLSTAPVKTVPTATYQPVTVSVLDGNGNLITSLPDRMVLTVSGGNTVGTAVYGQENGSLTVLSPDPQGGFILPLQQGMATFEISSPSGQTLTYTIADATIPSLKPVVAVGTFTASPPPGAGGGGGGGAPPAPPTTPQVSATPGGLKALIPSEGGMVSGATVPVTLQIPQGSFPSGTTINISALAAASLPAPLHGRLIGTALAFSSSAGEPAKPVSATFSYDPTVLGNRSPLRLGVYTLTGEGTWQYVGGTVDPANHTITVSLPHLSTYALLLDTRTFPDVPASFWGYSDIRTLVARHVVQGYPDGSFAPNQPVTRAEFVAMLVRALSVSAPASPDRTFRDVPSDAWAYPAVEAAVSQGWIQGVSATSFDPNAPITREEAAAILARAVGPIPLNGAQSASFADQGAIASWATAAVQEDASMGLIRGMPGGSYDPLGIATRAQTAAMVVRLLRYKNLLP